MKHLPQWFLWKLVWDAEEGKYQKRPAYLTGEQMGEDSGGAPANLCTHAQAVAALQALHAVHPPRSDRTYVLGFWLTADSGYWFFDMDKCVDTATGELLPLAQGMLAAFPGAMGEFSSSGRGLHIFGRGTVPLHRTTPERAVKLAMAPMEMEFYTENRGIAFGFDDPWGDCELQFDMSQLCAQYFPPPSAVAESDGVRRPEWRGPEDDDVLIQRMLSARPSAAAAFGTRASLQDLWEGKGGEGNEADAALAQHVAFWTGCDAPRMERIMKRSKMYRPKWDDRRLDSTYLRVTIMKACGLQTSVYVEREHAALPPPPAPSTPLHVHVAPDLPVDLEAFIERVNNTGSFQEVVSLRMAEAQQMQIHPLELDRVCNALIARMKLFGGGMAIGQMRKLIMDRPAGAASVDVPEWMHSLAFVRNGDYLFDTARNKKMSITAFVAEYSDRMPLKANGRRENPYEWAIEKWKLRVVDDALYMPTMGASFTLYGSDYVNLYNPASLPGQLPVDANTQAMIERFTMHLWLMCGKRAEVYGQLLLWMAYCVQHPGKKIKWMPLIVGVPGDGKSILADVLFAAMGGSANCRVTGLNTLKNSGGFTDWAHGRCLNFIEEIYLVGEKRFEFYEAMKNFIELATININPKGKVTFDVPNTTNHIANSNHRNGMPLADGDRRVMVIFSPYDDANAAAVDRGLGDRNELPAWIKGIGDSCREAPGAWRTWLCSIDTSGFQPSGRAPETPERLSMIAASKDENDGVLEDCLDAGGLGISREIFSSPMLQQAVETATRMGGGQMPRTSGWTYALSKLGYEKYPRRIKWKGKPHNVWHLPSLKIRDDDHARSLLDGTQGT